MQYRRTWFHMLRMLAMLIVSCHYNCLKKKLVNCTAYYFLLRIIIAHRLVCFCNNYTFITCFALYIANIFFKYVNIDPVFAEQVLKLHKETYFICPVEDELGMAPMQTYEVVNPQVEEEQSTLNGSKGSKMNIFVYIFHA